MDAGQTSCQLLDYFDGAADHDSSEKHSLPTRGVGWVLGRAAALAVLFFAAGVLSEFTYSLAAERTLARAARAAAFEATLPRASLPSIAQVVERRVAGYPRLGSQLRLHVEQNGLPVVGRFRPQQGDRLSVTLAAPSWTVLPDWLRLLTAWRGDSQITGRAEQNMPGPALRVSAPRR